jgi:hypothetical protein
MNDFLNFISNYKFIICFENTKFETYLTEKIINPYLAIQSTGQVNL